MIFVAFRLGRPNSRRFLSGIGRQRHARTVGLRAFRLGTCPGAAKLPRGPLGTGPFPVGTRAFRVGTCTFSLGTGWFQVGMRRFPVRICCPALGTIGFRLVLSTFGV